MKRILKFGVPIAVVAIFLTAAVAYSFGSRHGSSGVAKDFMMYRLDKLSKELNLLQTSKQKWIASNKIWETQLTSDLKKERKCETQSAPSFPNRIRIFPKFSR